MNMTRRDLMRAAMLVASASGFGWMKALAAPASDYKALVCVFLNGGNDGNNLIVPLNTDEYAAYATVRGGLALPKSSDTPNTALLSLGAPKSQPGREFGLHPALSALLPMWQQGKLAMQCNVGSLVAPLTMAEYKANRNRPYSLFSHSDQQAQWQTAESEEVGRTGWGGRLADAALGLNGGVTIPSLISLSGSTLFGVGRRTSPLVSPASGSFGLSGTGTSASAKARTEGIAALLGMDRNNILAAAANNALGTALNSAAIISPIINNSAASVATHFTGLTGNFNAQLLAVAKLIEARASLGLSRQIFFVQLGGFDTHSNQISAQDGLFAQLGNSLAAFYKAMEGLGLANQVTAFTSSDFSRTLRPASGAGSDHAWGNHHMVLGGAVKGGDFYGAFPTLALKGPDDIDGAGRWLPTTSIDQYAATFARWFGVADSELTTVLPYLSRFNQTHMGFL